MTKKKHGTNKLNYQLTITENKGGGLSVNTECQQNEVEVKSILKCGESPNHKKTVSFNDVTVEQLADDIKDEVTKEVRHHRRTLSSVGKFTLLSEVPTNLSITSCAMILEKPGIKHELLHKMIKEKLTSKYYRFRSKVVEYTTFEEIKDLDLDGHVKYEKLNVEDDLAEEEIENALRLKLSSFMNVPLDLNKPLWEVIIIDDYPLGWVLFIRAHHCLGDGTSMALVLNQLCDQPININLPGEGGKSILKSNTRDKVKWRWTNIIFFWKIFQVLYFFFIFALGCALLAYKYLREGLRGKDPITYFKGILSVKKRVAYSLNKISVDDVRKAAKPFHATVNDVMLSCMAGALDRYSHRRDAVNPNAKLEKNNTHTQSRIRVAIPVNVRPPTELDIKPSNKFGFIITSLPIGLRTDPVKQLKLTKSNMDFNKRLPEQFVSYKTSQYCDLLPAPIIRGTFEYLANFMTGVLTNVRGSSEATHINGLLVKDIIAFVPPPSGVGLGVAVFSYRGRVTVSFVTDDNLIKDPEMLVKDFEDCFEQLLQQATADSLDEYVLDRKNK
ncbi:hypothetical protein AKO1_007876 [Acrasis kona]|uniref:Diacylglycerol O-acyltransferase n=1 Tax=Acrasis kona TaxID=1008807 RepID=A0AAW2YNA7_9EUKA